jgi:hypothetical protein
MLYLSGDAAVRALAARVTTLESAGTSAPNWEGQWTIASGQVEYLFADATVLSGTATGDASTDAIAARVDLGGLTQESDEYEVGTDRLTLTSSPAADAVGQLLTIRCFRAA